MLSIYQRHVQYKRLLNIGKLSQLKQSFELSEECCCCIREAFLGKKSPLIRGNLSSASANYVRAWILSRFSFVKKLCFLVGHENQTYSACVVIFNMMCCSSANLTMTDNTHEIDSLQLVLWSHSSQMKKHKYRLIFTQKKRKKLWNCHQSFANFSSILRIA